MQLFGDTNVRCDCCNRNLNDFESTLKHAITGEYLNTCKKCLDGLNIPVVGREDLNPEEEITDWDELDECVDYGEDENE